MQLRKFNQQGIERFDEIRASAIIQQDDLDSLLGDRRWSGAVSPAIEVERIDFPTRFEVGAYFYALFDGASIPNLDIDQGIWTWLAAYRFKLLCPTGKKPGDRARWVLSNNYRHYYRHLLAGPYQIYKAHSDNPRRAMAVLANQPHEPGDIAEQLASRQEIVTNRCIMEVATRLYIDPSTDRPKTGAAAREQGSARRLAMVLNQLDLTWDLYRLEPDKLIELLPDEFERFKS